MYFPVLKSIVRIGTSAVKYRSTIKHHQKLPYYIANHFHLSALNLANMTNYSESYIKDKLSKELEPIHVDVVDYSDGCGAKFNVVIVSPKFEGKSLLERHRMVNGILEEEMKTIHAFTQKTLTPEQWKKLQES